MLFQNGFQFQKGTLNRFENPQIALRVSDVISTPKY